MSIFNEAEKVETVSQADAGIAEEYSQRMKSGANWFYWVAALSLVNSVIVLTGGKWNFIVGLGVTQLIDGFMQVLSGHEGSFSAFSLIALMLDVVVAGVFALFGFFGGRGSIAMFIIGMILYVLDALIYLLVGDWLAMGFHAFALFFMGKGLLAAFEYRSAKGAATAVQP
ncbi:MAG TPA: hypothetical protein VGO50_03490 [Pyrinomonadaceae bacterium]|jgi:hypothetical protein|nr:hypothetical protein [Pyrinomonadaceae bacterium]